MSHYQRYHTPHSTGQPANVRTTDHVLPAMARGRQHRAQRLDSHRTIGTKNLIPRITGCPLRVRCTGYTSAPTPSRPCSVQGVGQRASKECPAMTWRHGRCIAWRAIQCTQRCVIAPEPCLDVGNLSGPTMPRSDAAAPEGAFAGGVVASADNYIVSESCSRKVKTS